MHVISTREHSTYRTALVAPENELLSSWREELRQQASQGSTAGREEELEGGGEEQEGEIEMLDENSNVEKTITDSESEEQFRASLRRDPA